jgi:hypothetical protein
MREILELPLSPKCFCLRNACHKVHSSKIKLRYNHQEKGIETQKPDEVEFA